MIYALVIVAAALAVLSYASRNWRRWWYRDINIPMSATKRTDLYFGYYGCLDDQVAETRGHVNLHFESQFNGEDKAIQNIVEAGVDCVLDVSAQVFTPYVKDQYRTVREDAYDKLHALFVRLREAGALKHVKVIYPIDEPNNTVGDWGQLQRGIEAIHIVAAQYPELAGYKLAVIYAADKPFIGQSMYDWIGFDDYDKKSAVLVSEQYRALVVSLLPYQRTIIVPGGAYGQDPLPFVAFAQSNPHVAVVMPFLWLDDQHGSVGAPGIRSNGMAAQYAAAGRMVA